MARPEQDLEQFLREQLRPAQGGANYMTDIKAAWQVVEWMIRKHHCELKLEVYVGITGQHWVAAFYSPILCRRYEASGSSAPLAICRAAREAVALLKS